MEIPYTVAARPDTGLNNGKLGIWLFLASEVMLFGALFATYIMLRMGAPESTWPMGREVLDVPKATLNTIVLITSSVTMVMAWASLMRRNFWRYRLYMGGTVLLGLVFLFIKYFEYSHKIEHHNLPSTSTFLAIYFTMTALHGLHVVGGMLVNSYFLGRLACTGLSTLVLAASYTGMVLWLDLGAVWLTLVALLFLFLIWVVWRFNRAETLWKENPEWFTNRVEHSGLFWHFVDLVWIFLFPIFYLL